MAYLVTTATRKLSELRKRIRGVAGGASASKTDSILLLLIDYAQATENKVVSVVSESLPHLKKGAIRDFLNIMKGHNYYNDDRWNRTDFIYAFETGSIIEFFSAAESYKVRGPRRNVLFINEANNVSYETYTQLEIRTRDIVWLDWNPVSEFWWYTEVVGKQDADFITLTYKDNEGLHPAEAAALEARRGNKNWWKVYGEGQLGEAEGRIYKDWAIIDGIPHEASLRRYGLDFGYTNDPTAIVAVYYYNGGYIFHELVYQYGMTNQDIADFLKTQAPTMTIADSAEPKSIAEIKRYGINIVGSQKGQGSVLQGIQFVQGQRISVTGESTNLIKEYRNYLWMTDKEGKIINEPQGFLDHCMAAVRYAMDSFRPMRPRVQVDVGGVKPYFQGLPG